jgi:hypothetical protein
VHVLDLAGASAALSGSAGPALDETAKAQMRRRYEDLQEEVAEAERWGDWERVARAEGELDQLAQAVAAAVGLGGRDRPEADQAERARKAIGNRIRETIARIAAADPALGRHLANSVHLGAYCSYEPDRSVTWEIRP